MATPKRNPNRPARNIRIDDRLWMLAKQKAEREYTNVTAVITRLLYEWVREDFPDTNQPAPKKRGRPKKENTDG